MTASVFFSLSALFLKKFRKIISEELHPCSCVLEYPHRLFSFSTILSKFYPRWIDFHVNGISWVLKGTLFSA